MSQEILILSGPVHCGKTSLLQNWIINRQKIAGFLTPDIEGERFFLNVDNKELFPMNASADEAVILKTGRFSFSSSNFQRASATLMDACNSMAYNELLIDEIGPIELNKQDGFYSALLYVLSKPDPLHRLILVVREQCLEKAIHLINNYPCKVKVCSTADFRLKAGN